MAEETCRLIREIEGSGAIDYKVFDPIKQEIKGYFKPGEMFSLLASNPFIKRERRRLGGLLKILPVSRRILSSFDNRTVLVEVNACSCFINLTLNCLEKGGAIMMHNTWTTTNVEGGMSEYKDAVSEGFGQETTTTLVGGLMRQNEMDQASYAFIVKKLGGITKVIRPVIKEGRVELCEDFEIIENPEPQHGLIYIPKEVSSNGKQTVLVVTGDFNNSGNVLTQTVDCLMKVKNKQS